MSWIFFSLLANAAIISVEYLNRSGSGAWLSVLPRTLPLIIVAQYSLFRAWNGSPHWLQAWVVFTIGNSIVRVLAVRTFALGEVGSWPLAIGGVAVMMLGGFLVKGGLK